MNLCLDCFSCSVTFAFFVVRKVSLARLVLYVLAQMLGSAAGAQFLYGSIWRGLGSDHRNYTRLGTTLLNQQMGVQPGEGVWIEATLTFILVTTVFSVSDPKRIDVKHFGPIACGFVVIALCIMGVSLCVVSWLIFALLFEKEKFFGKH